MYNLSPRKSLPIVGCTTKNVAANTYTLCSPFVITKKNPVPFLSSAKRDTFAGKKPYTESLYDADYRSKIPGGGSLRNRSKRFVYDEGDTPGPTAYDPKKPKCQKMDTTLVPGKGRLYACRVPYTLKGSGPSVPTHGDENGYSLSDDGDLIKIPPDDHDRTLGPAFYKIPEQPCHTTRRYKGCRWSRRKTQRSSLSTSSNPGPGEYDIRPRTCRRHEEDEEFRAMARLLSFVPRYADQVEMRTLCENLPGPGQYDPKTSSFGTKPLASINPVPFIAGDKRFKHKVSNMPAPDRYEVNNFTIKTKNVSRKQSFFGFNALRFPDKKQAPMPGPGQYEIKTFMEAKVLCKGNPYSTVQAPFNQTSVRKIGFVTDEDYSRPGPDVYTLEPFEKEPGLADGCVFKSRTDRFPEQGLLDEANAATYNITETYKKNCGKISYNAGNVPFMSAQTREGFIKCDDNPGPGDYHIEKSGLGKGYYFSTTPRFTSKGDEIPGPGTYTIHPSVGLSVYKAIGTHNLRLKENVCRCKLRHAPDETYDDWIRTNSKRKKLRWFSKPSAEYRHCVYAMT